MTIFNSYFDITRGYGIPLNFSWAEDISIPIYGWRMNPRGGCKPYYVGPGRPIVPVRIGLAHQYCDTTLPPAIPSQIYHRFIQIPIFCDQTFATDTVEEILRWYLWSIMVYPLIYSGFQHVSTIPAWWWISQPPTVGRAAGKCRKPLRSRGWKQEAQNLFWGWGAMTFRSEEHVIPYVYICRHTVFICIHPYRHTYIHACMHVCIPTHLPTYLPTYIHR